MTLYVLDTDHISLQQRGHPIVLQQLRVLGQADSVAVAIITVEEQIRGRLEIVRRRSAILVTRNTRDFAQVPDLIIQDWSVP